MKRFLVLLAFVSTMGFAIYSKAETSKLSQPYRVSFGDWVAYRLSDMIRINEDLSAPTLVEYDKIKKKIVVKIYGSRARIEETSFERGAKGSLQAWWKFIKNRHIPVVEKNYGVKLKEEDYIVIYLNRKAKGGPKEIIRIEDGKTLLPTK